jgi:hypothetical protein
MIYKRKNKTSLFHHTNFSMISPSPQEHENLLAQRGKQHHHGNEMDGEHEND